MAELSTTLSIEEIKEIGAKDDFHIAPYRADGETFGTSTWIWSVEVDGRLFVRAYNGVNSRWYQSAKEQKAGKIEAAGMVKKVTFKPIEGDINDAIDQAYRNKYSNSPYLSSMISSKAKEATVEVSSFD